jgi:hypothetical protein
MEGAAMTFVSVNPHSPLFCSPASDASWFSLSHSYAQMADSDILVRLKGLSPAMICARYDREAYDIIHLFLDFKEKFPHSNLQDNLYDD